MSEFTREQLELWASNPDQLAPELVRRMNRDLLDNDNGQVAEFCREVERLAESAFDVDWGLLLREEAEDIADEMLGTSEPESLQPFINRVAAAAPFASLPDDVLLQTVRVLSQERHRRNLPAGEIFSRVRTEYGCRFRGRLEKALEFGAREGIFSVEERLKSSTSTRGSNRPGATASFYALATNKDELYLRLVHTLCLQSTEPPSSLAVQLLTWAQFFDVPLEWQRQIKNWDDESLRDLKKGADNG